jgi:hypothetical protein
MNQLPPLSIYHLDPQDLDNMETAEYDEFFLNQKGSTLLDDIRSDHVDPDHLEQSCARARICIADNGIEVPPGSSPKVVLRPDTRVFPNSPRPVAFAWDDPKGDGVWVVSVRSDSQLATMDRRRAEGRPRHSLFPKRK